MNCQAVQNQIIALPDPRQLSPALLAHVTECGACQAWARQAARLELLLEQLPVPPAPAEKKETMIGDLMQADPVIQPTAVPATRPSFASVAGRFVQRNASYVGGLAAAVLVVVGIAWYASKPTQVTPPLAEIHKHPLLEKMVKRDIALARAETPAKRLEELGGMAEELAGETRGMARVASPAELNDLARWYEKVVTKGMVPQAKNLPVHLTQAEKRKVLEPLAAKLETDAVEADKLSREAPQDAQPTLKRIADTARDGARELSRQGN